MKYGNRLAGALLSAALITAACGGGASDESEDTEQETDAPADEDPVVEDDSSGDDSDTGDESTTGGTEESTDEASSDSSDGDDTPTDSEDSDAATPSDGSSDTIGIEEINHDARGAVDAAMEEFDGELVGLELDNEDNQWVYEVDLQNESEEYSATLSVDDLSIVNEETDSDDDQDTGDQFTYGNAVPAEEAMQTALDEAGGEIEGFSLDMDDGQMEYDIELKNTDNGEADILIAAESGDIIETDYD
ncbi:PepSY domain-containing protein [Salinicoccus albus]|uniref:PepSY domain-containing protein n=1 Tax=Salinicoccus albus TaxID=418756 RepID=UPI00036082ED|nr:PepSY domain-containing protein [Salinicoccus albus]